MFKLSVALTVCICLAPGCGCAAAPNVEPAGGSILPPFTHAAFEQLLQEQENSLGSPYANQSDDEASSLPTAVYDILAHIVVLPDGSRLEAHSGFGERADDPRFVRERMRGATPPATYDLQPRKGLFHGVAALRLLPVLGNVFGRAGLLAHTYLLRGREGQSNGCVVFRDYDAFLKAFREGRIKRLRVIPAIGDMAVRGNNA